MKQFEGLVFENFKENDISTLTPIMRRAFDEDARIHLGHEGVGPQGYNNGDFLRKFALNKDSTAYKVSMDGKTIGCVILWINKKTNINFLGNIFIDSDIQSKGLGLKIWRFVEAEYPKTVKWCTETPIFSRRNHNFYINKCGFHVVKIEKPKDELNGSFILEKQMR